MSRSAYWGNSLNTSFATAAQLFTDSSDNSQWACFSQDNGPSGAFVDIAHFKSDGTVSVQNGAGAGLPLFSVAGLPADQHNGCSIAIDTNGILWLAYDMHNSALKVYKSNAARNPGAWTNVSPMVNSTVEAVVTFPLFFTNPNTGALYFTFEKGGGDSAVQYFYCYNAGTLTWAGCSGTSTNGQMFSNSTIGSGTTFVNGLPQWDKTTGTLWFNWSWESTQSPNFWNCGDTPNNVPCGIYLLGWTGSSFVNISGTAQTLPIQQLTMAPAYAIHAGQGPSVTIWDSFSIDSSENAYFPYFDVDGSGFMQAYVEVINLNTHSVGTPVKLTSNAGAFSPPAASGWLGESSFSCQSAPYSCGDQYVPSLVAFSNGSNSYVMYQDIYNWGNGIIVYKSSNQFSSFTSSYLLGSNRFNPNHIPYPDQVRQYNGTLSFLFENTNDAQYRFSTAFCNTSNGSPQCNPDMGKIWIESPTLP